VTPALWCVAFGTLCTFLAQLALDAVLGYGAMSVIMSVIIGFISMLGLAAYLRARNGDL
jgi:hypothetical protein